MANKIEWKASEKKHFPRTTAESSESWLQHFTYGPFRIDWHTEKDSRNRDFGEARLYVTVEHYTTQIMIPSGLWDDVEFAKEFAEKLLTTLKEV